MACPRIYQPVGEVQSLLNIEMDNARRLCGLLHRELRPSRVRVSKRKFLRAKVGWSGRKSTSEFFYSLRNLSDNFSTPLLKQSQQGPPGILYAVPTLPPGHTPESLTRALDALVQSLWAAGENGNNSTVRGACLEDSTCSELSLVTDYFSPEDLDHYLVRSSPLTPTGNAPLQPPSTDILVSGLPDLSQPDSDTSLRSPRSRRPRSVDELLFADQLTDLRAETLLPLQGETLTNKLPQPQPRHDAVSVPGESSRTLVFGRDGPYRSFPEHGVQATNKRLTSPERASARYGLFSTVNKALRRRRGRQDLRVQVRTSEHPPALTPGPIRYATNNDSKSSFQTFDHVPCLPTLSAGAGASFFDEVFTELDKVLADDSEDAREKDREHPSLPRLQEEPGDLMSFGDLSPAATERTAREDVPDFSTKRPFRNSFNLSLEAVPVCSHDLSGMSLDCHARDLVSQTHEATACPSSSTPTSETEAPRLSTRSGQIADVSAAPNLPALGWCPARSGKKRPVPFRTHLSRRTMGRILDIAAECEATATAAFAVAEAEAEAEAVARSRSRSPQNSSSPGETDVAPVELGEALRGQVLP